MERHKCKLCLKGFSNGRALGGHMRSHILNLPNPPANPKPEEEEEEEEEGEFQLPSAEGTDQSASSSSSSESSEREGEEEDEEEKNAYNYGLRENPKRSIRLVDPEFSFGVDAASVVLHDRESETESSKNPTRRRSKHKRKLLQNHHHWRHHYHQEQVENKNTKKFQVDTVVTINKSDSAEPEPMSSISGTTTEEDVAFCLMMLSRDIWKSKEQHYQEHHQEYQEYDDGDGDDDDDDEEKSLDETDESDEFKSGKTRRTRKYKCETCDKVFKSYQALGGHRASHKKLKLNAPTKRTCYTQLETEKNAGTSSCAVAQKKKIHECPYCYRVFSSGQALGGHKRSHVTGAAAAAAATARSSSKLGDSLSFIDLNLPAPVDDGDGDGGVSQIELSAVSDAEFVNYHNIKPK